MRRLLAPLLSLCPLYASAKDAPPLPDFAPRHYICYKAPAPPKIDGKINEAAWQKAPWSEAFVDIQGESHPHQPRHLTRMKMLWDDKYLYIAAEIQDPHVWGTLTERESIIFNDNDFEVFIDPDGDSHHYMEFEINALGTEWDLMLTKPYRDWGNKVLDCWNINGIRSAIHVEGSLNDGSDEDKGWFVEIAMPLDSLCEADKLLPAQGVQWRMNFSRVQWASRWNAQTKRYEKIAHPITQKQGMGAEDNWVWSAQGVINMHRPETWGFVQFSEKPAGTPSPDCFAPAAHERSKWVLRQLYYRMWAYHKEHGQHAQTLEEIKGHDIAPKAQMQHMGADWRISLPSAANKTLAIYSDGRCVVE